MTDKQEAVASMKDTVAFLTARFRDDEDAAKVILGITGDFENGETPSQEQINHAGEMTVDLLLSMTDLCLSMVKMFSMMLGCSEAKFIETFGMGMAILTEDKS